MSPGAVAAAPVSGVATTLVPAVAITPVCTVAAAAPGTVIAAASATPPVLHRRGRSATGTHRAAPAIDRRRGVLHAATVSSFEAAATVPIGRRRLRRR